MQRSRDLTRVRLLCVSFPMFGEGVKQGGPSLLSFTLGFLWGPLTVLYLETLLPVSPTARQLGRISWCIPLVTNSSFYIQCKMRQTEWARGLYTFNGLCFITELHYPSFPDGICNFSESTTNDFSLFVSCFPAMWYEEGMRVAEVSAAKEINMLIKWLTRLQ